MASTSFDGPWALEEAVVLLQRLRPLLELRGFSVGLTGSVLSRGISSHDVDIIVYPLQSTPRTDMAVAKEVLRDAGLRCVLTAEFVQSSWRKRGSCDEKHVEVWRDGNRRIDVFFLK